MFSGLLLALSTLLTQARDNADSPNESPDLLRYFEPFQPNEVMPQYRALWRTQVDEEAIRQPAQSIRLNGPGFEEVLVPLRYWYPRAGYIQVFNEDDPDNPISLPDPNARPGDFSWGWYGNLGYTDVSLTVERGVLAGRVWHQGRRFALRPSADGLLLAETNPSYWQMHPDTPERPQHIESSRLSQGAVPPVGNSPHGRPPTISGGPPKIPEDWDYDCDDPLPTAPQVVDVLILYTSGVESTYGGRAGTEAFMTQAMQDANIALRNTDINTVTFSLRGIEPMLELEPSLDEVDIAAARRRISGIDSQHTALPGTPGICSIASPGMQVEYDHVLGRRDALWADVVALARRDSDPIRASCGYTFVQQEQIDEQGCAYEPGAAFARFGYLVFDPDCGADELNLAHELGHQLGMEHDHWNSANTIIGAQPSCRWSFGHRLATGPYPFRTVMAYWEDEHPFRPGNACGADALCPKIPAFSNPQRYFNGAAGIGPLPLVSGAPRIGEHFGWVTRGVDTLQRLAPIVADFRPRPEAIFGHGFE